MKIVDQKTYRAVLQAVPHETKTIEGTQIAVAEHYTRTGEYFASATYSAFVPNTPVVTTYRVMAKYLKEIQT